MRNDTDFTGDPVTMVSVTVTNNTQAVEEFGLFDTVIDATYGPNGQKADWAILSSQTLDGSVIPGRSLTGTYAFEGDLRGEIVFEVELRGETTFWTAAR